MRFLTWAVIGVFALSLGCASAQDKDQRNLWLYEGGWYQKKDGKEWIELNFNTYAEGKVIRYAEVKRTEAFVELFDKERNIAVRLYDSTEEHKAGNDPWETGYKGRWKK